MSHEVKFTSAINLLLDRPFSTREEGGMVQVYLDSGLLFTQYLIPEAVIAVAGNIDEFAQLPQGPLIRIQRNGYRI